MLAASLRLWTSPFKGQNGAPTYFKDVVFAMIRTQMASLNTAEERHVNGLTKSVYLKYAKDTGFEPKSVILSSGVEAHWLGDDDAEKVIVYLHGESREIGGGMGC